MCKALLRLKQEFLNALHGSYASPMPIHVAQYSTLINFISSFDIDFEEETLSLQMMLRSKSFKECVIPFYWHYSTPL